MNRRIPPLTGLEGISSHPFTHGFAVGKRRHPWFYSSSPVRGDIQSRGSARSDDEPPDTAPDGAGGYFVAPLYPRLRRGLHDDARFAG